MIMHSEKNFSLSENIIVERVNNVLNKDFHFKDLKR